MGRVDAADRRRDHDARRRQRPGAAADDRAVSGGDRADPARQLAGDRAAEGARDARRARRGRRARDARRSRRTRPAGSSPSGSCAACRCASRSGRRTSRSRRCCSRAATRARRRRVPMDGPRRRACATLLDDDPADAARARAAVPRRAHAAASTTYDEFKQVMEGRPGFVVAPWCGTRRLRGADQGRDAGDDPQHAVRRRRRPKARSACSAASRRTCTPTSRSPTDRTERARLAAAPVALAAARSQRLAHGGVAAGEAFARHDGLEGGGDVIAHPAVFDLLPGGGERGRDTRRRRSS